MTTTELQERERGDGSPRMPQVNNVDLPSDARRLDGRKAMEHEDQGSIVGQPPAVAPEYMLNRDQHSEDVHHTVCSGRSEGECWQPDGISSINIH